MLNDAKHAVLAQYPVTGDLTRLLQSRPLGLLPVVNKPLVQHWMEAFARAGLTHITLVLSDFPEQIRQFVGDGSRWGFDAVNFISLAAVADETELLSRCGTVLPEEATLFSMNGFPGEGAAVRPLNTLADFWSCNINSLTRVQHRYGVTEEIYVAPLAQCDTRCRLEGRVHIANSAQVNEQCSIRDSILGHGVEVGSATALEESVVLPNTMLSDNLHLRRMVVDGGLVYSVDTGECLEINDEHLVCPVAQVADISLGQRGLAGLLWLFTLPLQLPFYLKGAVSEIQLAGVHSRKSLTLNLLASANPSLSRLPWLKQAALGQLPLFGIRECSELPEWAADQANLTPGVISLADVSLPAMAGADEIAISNSFQMNSKGLVAGSKLFASWIGNLFASN